MAPRWLTFGSVYVVIYKIAINLTIGILSKEHIFVRFNFFEAVIDQLFEFF
jgi:hypothetical protein